MFISQFLFTHWLCIYIVYKIVIVHNVFCLKINEPFIVLELTSVSGCNANMINQTFKMYLFDVPNNVLMGETGNYVVLNIYNN